MRRRWWVFRSFWRSWWLLCPNCNSDAPAIDHCKVCGGFHGRASLSQAARWLYIYFTEYEGTTPRGYPFMGRWGQDA